METTLKMECKGIGRFLPPTVLMALAILSACSRESEERASPNGSWTVFSYEDLEAGSEEFKTPANSWDLDVQVHFDDTQSPMVISGRNTTNNFSAQFTYTGPDQFTITNYFTTFAGQPWWGDEFVIALHDPDLKYSIQGDKLAILYGDGGKRMNLNRD